MLTASCDVLADLRRQLDANAYPGYVYGYPHKKAYRPLERAVPLAEAWGAEEKGSLFCYVHLPFCNQRCSFCNLFTYVPGDSPVPAFLDALEREMAAYADALGTFRFARLYLGGGTPTYLTTRELERLVTLLKTILKVDPAVTHGCIEASPETLDGEKVACLQQMGFRRLSLGVQSFVPEELRQVNRKFDFAAHESALMMIGRAGFPEINVDLIYGLPGQTAVSWTYSLRKAIDSPATSLFLYPLYVRPLTGLDRRADVLPCPTTHDMGAMYDRALDLLGAAGFKQVTMRQFRRDHQAESAGTDCEYRCQRHGMVGLGAGARSYTAGLHYSTPWRMVARNIRSVIEEYQQRQRAGDSAVRHGFVLDPDEQRRRFVIQSLLYDGLDLAEFAGAFAGDARALFAEQYEALAEERLMTDDGRFFRLTARGVRHADVVGQLFFSERVRSLMARYEYDA